MQLNLMLIQGSRPLVNTVVALKNHGVFLMAGPHYRDGILVIAIGAGIGFLVGGGITTQEVGKWMGLTGLDLSLAFQRAFSPHGTTLGATISWMHVPIR